MNLIVELIKAIIDAIEESQGRKKPQPIPAPAPDDTAETQAVYEAQQRILEKQEALRRQREAEESSRAAAEAQAAAQQKRQRATAAADSAEAAHAARPRVPTGAQRLARLLRQPATARELILLGDLLGPPKALRRGRP